MDTPLPVTPQPQVPPSMCPSCHILIRPTDYFCFNCGKNLKPKPLSVSLSQQLIIYISSLLLPPIGIIWGIRYLKESNATAKVIGVVAIVITTVVLIICVYAIIGAINTVNEQVNKEVQNILQF